LQMVASTGRDFHFSPDRMSVKMTAGRGDLQHYIGYEPRWGSLVFFTLV